VRVYQSRYDRLARRIYNSPPAKTCRDLFSCPDRLDDPALYRDRAVLNHTPPAVHRNDRPAKYDRIDNLDPKTLPKADMR
jgi:hypothetical protein